MTGSFHFSLFEGTLHIDKIHVWFKIANITHALPVPVCRLISHRHVRSFRVYMIPLRDFVPEWNSQPGTTTGVNSRRGDSRRHDILWWYHENKCRAMRGNRSEFASARMSPRCHVMWLTAERVDITMMAAFINWTIDVLHLFKFNIWYHPVKSMMIFF